MKTKALLLVFLVSIAFTGLATAATQQVLVSEAYDEQVLVSEAWNESVLVSPAYDLYDSTLAIWHAPYDELIKEAWSEEVLVSDAYVINHPAITHFEEQLVSEAWNESVLVSDAWDEQVEAGHDGYVAYGQGEYVKKSGGIKYYAKYMQGQTFHGFLSVPVGNSDPCQSKDWKWTPIFNTVHHDAVYETVEHPAVFETVEVVDVEAWDEVVPAVYKTVEHPAEYLHHAEYYEYSYYYDMVFDSVEDWVDWVWNTIPVAPGNWGGASIEHVPAVYKIVEHPAVYDTIHHPAVYETVEVPDPVMPVPAENVEEGGVAMLETL